MKRTFSSDVKRIAGHYFDGLATPFALSVKQKMLDGCWEDLQKLYVDPRAYTDAQSYMLDACAAGFLKKYQDFPTDPAQRKARAMEKWWDGEKQCHLSNLRLAPYLPRLRYLSDGQEPHVDELFQLAKRIIAGWIGTEPPPLIEGRFGPGSTYSDFGETATILHKIGSNDPTMTHDVCWYLPQWLGTQWGRSFASRRREVSVVPGNRVQVAPKTAWIDRVTAAEPSINVFYQLGRGKQLRKLLLRRAKWDLAHSQEIHRLVAEKNSIEKLFFTEDLSNASDTICRILVEILLSPSWYETLDQLRSKRSLVDGQWVILEKFSSMGNGFTFELETIIFAALTCATIRLNGGVGKLGEDVFVYGDDIIAEEVYLPAVRSVLAFCGFTSNAEKSFSGTDSFRESCGGDFFNGSAVRPHFLKEEPTGPQDYIKLHNGLRRVREQLIRLNHDLPGKILAKVADNIPTSDRVYGPLSLGDICLHAEYQHWTVKVVDSIRYVKVLKPARGKVTHFERFDDDVVLACATYGSQPVYDPVKNSKDSIYYPLMGEESVGIVGRSKTVAGYSVDWIPFS